MIASRSPHILLDPAKLSTWSALQHIARTGIRTLHQWGPQDGMAFPAAQPAHQHAVPTLIACLAGCITVFGRTRIDLVPGDLLLVEPGCWHHQPVSRPGAIAFGMGFIADWCDVVFLDSTDKLWGTIPRLPYRGLVDALMAESGESERLRLVDEILGWITQERIDRIDWIHPAVHAMAEYLWKNLHLRLDVDTMVASSSCGRTAAFRLFRAFFGRPPKQEIIAQRLALAAHLSARGYTPAEAARRSGFTTCTDLTRSFRTHAAVCQSSPNGSDERPAIKLTDAAGLD